MKCFKIFHFYFKIFAKYLGKWYEIEHIEAPFEPNLKCTTAVYTQQNATQIYVENQGIKKWISFYLNIYKYFIKLF